MLPPIRSEIDNRHFVGWNYQSHQAAYPYQYQYPVYQQRTPSFNHHGYGTAQSASSTPTEALYTPSSGTTYNYWRAGTTIQPSAFNGWENTDQDARARGNTISGAILAGETPLSRPMERRLSSPFPGPDEGRWDGTMISPSICERLSEASEEDLHPVEITYITDAETKQTKDVNSA